MDPLRGDGVLLRLPEPDDRQRWLDLLHDAEQLRFGMPAVVPLPETPEDLDPRIESAAHGWSEGGPVSFVVAAPEDPRLLLGTIGWSFHAPAPLRVADVGYGIHPDSRGRGVATRSLQTLTRWLLTDEAGPRLARVQLDHSVEHPASCRVATRAGFEREGVRRGYLPLRDADAPDGVRRHDVCLHGYLPR